MSLGQRIADELLLGPDQGSLVIGEAITVELAKPQVGRDRHRRDAEGEPTDRARAMEVDDDETRQTQEVCSAVNGGIDEWVGEVVALNLIARHVKEIAAVE